jgi:hypothetical protein
VAGAGVGLAAPETKGNGLLPLLGRGAEVSHELFSTIGEAPDATGAEEDGAEGVGVEVEPKVKLAKGDFAAGAASADLGTRADADPKALGEGAEPNVNAA